MNCDSAAEFVSALCDGEVIPPDAAGHIGSCATCQERLRDYLEAGVEMRRAASLAFAEAVQARVWSRPEGRVSKWWQKGWGTMRIPRLAFASMFLVIMGLAASLLVVKVGAHSDGTVVLLSTTGPKGPLMDCPLSTVDKNQAGCTLIADVGGQILEYQVNLLSRDRDRVLLAVRTRTEPTTPGTRSYSPTEIDNEPAKEMWFELGKSLKVDVPEIGTLTLTGEWLDHMPMMGSLTRKMDHLDPDPNEIRFASPLILKDKTVVGDLDGAIGGIFTTDSRDWANAIYIPAEGRFLIAQVPLKGAIEAHVKMGRISFEEGGHSWEIVNGVPVSREDHLWVLHEPDFKKNSSAQNDAASFGNQKLVQTDGDLWEPKDMQN